MRALFLVLMALSLISINVNRLRDGNKRTGLLQFFRCRPKPPPPAPSLPDVVCLQEVHCVSKTEVRDWFRSSGFSVLTSPGSSRSCGCAIFYKYKLTLVASFCDASGCFLHCFFSFADVTFNVPCLYAPNRNPARDQSHVLDVESCGNLNTVFDRGLDRSGSDIDDTSRESTPFLIRLFDSCAVVDIWRALHPSDRSFTWLRPNSAAVSRMNLVALPTFWLPFVSSFNHLPCPFSDHCVVALSFAVPQVLTGGPEVWKLSVSVLVEEEYFSLISSFWASWRERKSDFLTVMDWWEVAKSKIKGLSVTYCKARAARLRSRRDFLVRLVPYLKGRVYGGRCHRVDPYQAALAELRQLDLVEVEGAWVRARVRWVEEGDCSSSYFCKLE